MYLYKAFVVKLSSIKHRRHQNIVKAHNFVRKSPKAARREAVSEPHCCISFPTGRRPNVRWQQLYHSYDIEIRILASLSLTTVSCILRVFISLSCWQRFLLLY